jgi:amino acid transporter
VNNAEQKSGHVDVEMLQNFGYGQELRRRMTGFGNFTMSFMIIGVFWCACINIQQGIGTAGMFGISGAWLIGGAIALSTALAMAEIASAIPTAGGLYHWSSAFGGRGWGWATAWLNLLAYTFSVAGTAVATYLLFIQMILGWMFHINTSNSSHLHQEVGVAIILGTQAILNHVGVRTLARLSELGAYVTFIGAAVLISTMLCNIHPSNLEHIFTYTNNTGGAGDNIVPYTNSPILILGYSILLPMWIITSYDASAHTSEETIGAARSVPRAIVYSVILSIALGSLLLIVLGLAMSNPSYIAEQGDNAFQVIFQQIDAPKSIKEYIVISLVFSSYICGACGLTGFSRALFAFSRDRGLPADLRIVSYRFRTPAVAIWVGASAALAVTLYSSAFSVLAAGTALFYQLSYAMAIGAAMFSKKRTYGPFKLGIWSKFFGLVGIVGGAYVFWIGLNPPTQILANYFVGIFVLLGVIWFGFERKRFPGPPHAGQTIAACNRDILTSVSTAKESGKNRL